MIDFSIEFAIAPAISVDQFGINSLDGHMIKSILHLLTKLIDNRWKLGIGGPQMKFPFSIFAIRFFFFSFQHLQSWWWG